MHGSSQDSSPTLLGTAAAPSWHALTCGHEFGDPKRDAQPACQQGEHLVHHLCMRGVNGGHMDGASHAWARKCNHCPPLQWQAAVAVPGETAAAQQQCRLHTHLSCHV